MLDVFPDCSTKYKKLLLNSPVSNLTDALRALLGMEAPPGRSDLRKTPLAVADDVLRSIEGMMADVCARDKVAVLMKTTGITANDVRVLLAYKMEVPYPVYKWLNGWLQSPNDDATIIQGVGPLVRLLDAALRKLPLVKSPASRAIKVGNIPALCDLYKNYRQEFSMGTTCRFWSFTSYSASDAVMAKFRGTVSMVFACGSLIGVDMEPFRPLGMPQEFEILPLCPTTMVVQSAVRVDRTVVVSVEHRTSATPQCILPPLKECPQEENVTSEEYESHWSGWFSYAAVGLLGVVAGAMLARPRTTKEK